MPDSLRLLIIKHSPEDETGHFSDILSELTGPITEIIAPELQTWPAAKEYDAVPVLGGIMQVWDRKEHPWLTRELQFIRDTILLKRAYLGICLGHQLLATAMGGEMPPFFNT